MGRRKGSRIRKKNGELVRILFAAHHCCIRVHKQLKSLKKLGYEIDILTNSISYGTDAADRIYFYHNKEQFMKVMAEIGHVYSYVTWHNEPDEQALWLYESRKANNHTYLLGQDWHDIDSIRLHRPNKSEVKIFRLLDYFVFVSEPCRKLAEELYDFKQPSTVFAHYCNRDVVSYEPGEEDRAKRTGVVYEGGANPPDHLVPPEQRQVFRYRTIYPYFKEAVSNGNDLTLYIGNPPGYMSHQDLGAKVYPPTIYNKMMDGMKSAKWGWVLFGAPDDPQTKNTTCNKFFEYIKAGCVPICCWCEETERWNEKYQCGINLKHPDELGNIEENFGQLYPKLKDRVDEINVKGILDSENHIHIIESLLREAGNK